MTRKPKSTDQIIREKIDAGYSDSFIQSVVGVDLKRVARIRKTVEDESREGIENQARDMISGGYRNHEIAEDLGISRYRVARIRKAYDAGQPVKEAEPVVSPEPVPDPKPVFAYDTAVQFQALIQLAAGFAASGKATGGRDAVEDAINALESVETYLDLT